jgi:predicted glycosyltransferase
MTNQQIAEQLLWPCWRGIPDGYRMDYARNIWQQFENQIRSAAYTSSLSKFFESLSAKLGIQIRSVDVAKVAAALNDPDEAATLRKLRNETKMLVLLVRVQNQKRKEIEYEEF